jgi:hypothetical protein
LSTWRAARRRLQRNKFLVFGSFGNEPQPFRVVGRTRGRNLEEQFQPIYESFFQQKKKKILGANGGYMGGGYLAAVVLLLSSSSIVGVKGKCVCKLRDSIIEI